jgi:adenosylhomocysteine nucleosidase
MTTSSLAELLSSDSPLKVAIIGAMDQEVEQLKDALTERELEQIAGFDFYTGKLNGTDVVLLKSGIGKVNAAIGTSILLDRYQPGCVINTGSAGGFDADLDVGDVVISDEVRHHDVDLTVFGYEPGQVPGLPPSFTPDPLLVRIAEQCISGMNGVRTVNGLIATGDTFMDNPERVSTTRALFPAMKACEMEAAAVAQACHRFQVPFIIVRALSDIAGKESGVSFKQFIDQAAHHSAEMVIAIVNRLREYRARH